MCGRFLVFSDGWCVVDSWFSAVDCWFSVVGGRFWLLGTDFGRGWVVVLDHWVWVCLWLCLWVGYDFVGGGADLGFGFLRWLCCEWVLGCEGFEGFPAWVAGMGVLEQESVG
jgi:hypothetical protein